jgi:hypothetical protein
VTGLKLIIVDKTATSFVMPVGYQFIERPGEPAMSDLWLTADTNVITLRVNVQYSLQSLADFYPLIANEAVDVVSISALHSGVTGCRQIANLAHAYALPVSMMNCQANFMAQAAAALPNHNMMEVVDPGGIARFDSCIEDGHRVGRRAGFRRRVDHASSWRSRRILPLAVAGSLPAPRRRRSLLRRPGRVPPTWTNSGAGRTDQPREHA